MTGSELYTDGGCAGRNPSPVGGAWAWRLVEDGRALRDDSGAVRPGQHHLGALVTSNQMEFMAVLRGLQAMPDGWSGTLCSDSMVTLGRVCARWATRGIPAAWVEELGRARARLGPVTPRQLDGHPSRLQLLTGAGHSGQPVSEHNVACDRACREASKHLVDSSPSPKALGVYANTR